MLAVNKLIWSKNLYNFPTVVYEVIGVFFKIYLFIGCTVSLLLRVDFL